jgi:hypothetical protein
MLAKLISYVMRILSHIEFNCRECLTCINLFFSQCSMTDNARTMRCALKREQVVFIQRRRIHSTLLKKVIFIQLIWRSDFYSTHLKKSSSFNSFEKVVFIQLIRTSRFHSIEFVLLYFIQFIWESRHLFN